MIYKVKQFVSHTFFVAEMFAGTPEESVDLGVTFSKFDNVLSGYSDNTPETAPKKVAKHVNVRSLSLRLPNRILENALSLDFRVLRIWF